MSQIPQFHASLIWQAKGKHDLKQTIIPRATFSAFCFHTGDLSFWLVIWLLISPRPLLNIYIVSINPIYRHAAKSFSFLGYHYQNKLATGKALSPYNKKTKSESLASSLTIGNNS